MIQTTPTDLAAFPATAGGGAPPALLTDGAVCLRQFYPDDIPVLYASARESLGELCSGMTWCHPGYSLEDSTSFVLKCHDQWEKGDHYSFAICDARDGAFLGSVGLSHVNPLHGFANVGYWVRTSQTGHGVATAATRLMARWAFSELRLNRLEIVIAVNNLASQRVAEKAGARCEGILRQRLVLNGQRLNAVMYALVPRDLEA